MREFVTLSWNLQKMGKSKAPLTARRIVDTIADSYNTMAKGKNLPLIGFFQEIVGNHEDVLEICEIFRKEFSRHLTDINVTAIETPAGPHNSEWIIVYTNKKNVKYEKLDIKSAIEGQIKIQEALAAEKYDNHSKSSRKSGRNKKFTDKGLEIKDIFNLKKESFMDDQYKKDWYRDGVICSIREEGREFRIASLHAPGPKVSNKGKKVLRAIDEAIAAARADVTIGDFNNAGTIEGDITNWDTGTTLKKDKADDFSYILSPHRWDRVTQSSSFNYTANVLEPVLPKIDRTQVPDRFLDVSDHALIGVSFSEKRVKVDDNQPRIYFDHPLPILGPQREDNDIFSMNAEKANFFETEMETEQKEIPKFDLQSSLDSPKYLFNNSSIDLLNMNMPENGNAWVTENVVRESLLQLSSPRQNNAGTSFEMFIQQ